MLVEILKPVHVRGEIHRSGVLDAPERVAQYWISTGAAKAVSTSPAPAGAPAAESGKKRF